MKLHRVYRDKKGFSLIELLVVGALISLLLGLSLLIGYDSVARSSVSNERDLVVSLLNTVRAKALANVNESDHGLYVDADNYVLFELRDGEDDFGESDEDSHREIPRGKDVEITGPDGTTDPFEIIFIQLSADVPEDYGVGTITLFGSGQSTTIEINKYGRIEW